MPYSKSKYACPRLACMQHIDENEAVAPSKPRFKKDDSQGGWPMFVRKDNSIFTDHTKVRRLLDWEAIVNESQTLHIIPGLWLVFGAEKSRDVTQTLKCSMCNSKLKVETVRAREMPKLKICSHRRKQCFSRVSRNRPAGAVRREGWCEAGRMDAAATALRHQGFGAELYIACSHRWIDSNATQTSRPGAYVFSSKWLVCISFLSCRVTIKPKASLKSIEQKRRLSVSSGIKQNFSYPGVRNS